MVDFERDDQGFGYGTQAENPGVQGDFGAGQGGPGREDPIVGDGDRVEGDEQPRREEDEPLIEGEDADELNGGSSGR